MRLVLDTNVVVSAFISHNSKPSQILKLVLQRKAEICYNSTILLEYKNVMLRRKFADKIHFHVVNQFINLIKSIGFSFVPMPSNVKLPDESDRIFYDTAKGSGSVLITGNIKHYPKEPFIILPSDFLKKYILPGESTIL